MKSTIAFGAGAILGAGAAILFAPEIDPIRKRLAANLSDSIARGQVKINGITSRVIRAADEVENKIHRIEHAVDAGVRTFKEATSSWSSSRKGVADHSALC